MKHKHLFAAGVIHVSLACLGILASVAFMLMLFVTPRTRESMDTTLVVAQFVVMFLIIGLYGVFGIGLIKHARWATGVPGYILAALSLPGFPVGTALGAYTIWAIMDFKKQGDRTST